MEGKEYYYLNGDTKVGPFTLDALKSAPINTNTLVWNNSLPDWVEANTLPELADCLAPQSTVTPPMPSAPTFNAGNATTNAGGGYNPNPAPPMPDNNLVWGILCTILCCLPLGIVSIINANKVAGAYQAGDYTGAQLAAADAKKWAIWGGVAAAVGGVIYVIVAILIALLGVSY